MKNKKSYTGEIYVTRRRRESGKKGGKKKTMGKK
jgi:hypothetical protein